MYLSEPPDYEDPLRDAAVAAHYRADETAAVSALLEHITVTPAMQRQTISRARELVQAIRDERRAHGGLGAFVHEFDLSSHEAWR